MSKLSDEKLERLQRSSFIIKKLCKLLKLIPWIFTILYKKTIDPKIGVPFCDILRSMSSLMASFKNN